ncbi:MAG: AAA family ATPase, partial [Actinomycetota bacterium]|nr:AAA family ATPase [Actinomycetota bacterium]
MADVELQVLGPVGLTVDGRPVALGGARQRAIVAYLALNGGQPVPIPRLVDEVWGLAAPRTVVKSLSTLASRLRHVLGPVGIELRFDDKGYVLDLPDGTLDLHRFRALLGRSRVAELEGDTARAVEHLRMALRRWRGAPLDGLSGPFVDGAVAELEAMREDTEAQLARLLLGEDDLDAAIELLIGLIERNPYREERWATLMEAYTRAGRRAEALATYQRAHRVFRDELGVTPGPQLRAAEQAALNAAPAAGVSPVRAGGSIAGAAGRVRRAATTGGGSQPPSGREAELALLRHEARTAALGELRAVVITGEPGIGKTHLVRAFVESMAGRDLVVVEGRCDPFGTVPLGPLLTLVEKAGDIGVVDESVLAEAPALLDALAGGTNEQSISDAGDLHRSQLLRDLRLVMRRFSITRPVVVVLEDFHWVDQLTAAALRFLGEEQRDAPVLFLVTAREPDVSRGAAAEVLGALAATQTVTRLHVGPVSREALAGVVADVLEGVEDPQRVLDIIDEGAGGNPLYARQLARHILD